MPDATRTLRINRAPVLALWASVVAQRLGHDRDAALTLGQALAGLNAHSKGVRLGIYAPTSAEVSDARHKARTEKKGVTEVELLGRRIPVMKTPEGLRAFAKDAPASPESVERYLHGKFGDALDEVRAEMERLAHAHSPRDLVKNGSSSMKDSDPKSRATFGVGELRVCSTLDGYTSSCAAPKGRIATRLWEVEHMKLFELRQAGAPAPDTVAGFVVRADAGVVMADFNPEYGALVRRRVRAAR